MTMTKDGYDDDTGLGITELFLIDHEFMNKRVCIERGLHCI